MSDLDIRDFPRVSSDFIPSWAILSEAPDGSFVLWFTRGNDCRHVCIPELDQRRYLAPALHNLAGCLFELEYPDQFMKTYFWEAQAIQHGVALTEEQKAIIARRKELSFV